MYVYIINIVLLIIIVPFPLCVNSCYQRRLTTENNSPVSEPQNTSVVYRTSESAPLSGQSRQDSVS